MVWHLPPYQVHLWLLRSHFAQQWTDDLGPLCIPGHALCWVPGATDILISYTYKIAFGSQVQDLGLASAISVVIFILVAAISLYGIRRSKVLEEFI